MWPSVGVVGGGFLFLSSSSVVPGVGFACRKFGVLMGVLGLDGFALEVSGGGSSIQ